MLKPEHFASFTHLTLLHHLPFLLFLLLVCIKHKPLPEELEPKAMASITEILASLPLGFRFRPTDEELVDHYLKHKLQGDEFVVRDIPDIDLCQFEPSQIPVMMKAYSEIHSDDQEWYFFRPLDHKYAKSKRSNRATKNGYWKPTGQERRIKARGTDNVIGNKKTLVFYKGRVRHGVKTNYVIHEYHATTFDDSQRTFVLCKLKKKDEQQAEGGTNALAHDGRMASGHENQATTARCPNVCDSPEMDVESFWVPDEPPSLQDPPIGIEWQESSPNSPFGNTRPRNENSSMHNSLTATGDRDGLEFANSVIRDEDSTISDARVHAFGGSICPESLLRAGSRDYRVSRMVQSSHGGTHPLSFNQETQEIIFLDDLSEVETSSCESIADKPLEIKSLEISSSPSTLRRSKNQYHPRAAARSQTHKKVSSNSASHLEDKKKLVIVESEKDQEKAQSLFPRSGYLVNAVIAILLLIVISWDMLSCLKCC